MQKVINVLRKAEDVFMILGMVTAVAVITMQIILRYCFRSALPWAEEVSRYLFIYFTWIGTSAAISTDEHIRLDIVRNKHPRLGEFLEPLVTIICLAMALFMLLNGIQLIEKMKLVSASSPTLRLPMYVFYAAIPISGGLMTVKYLYKLAFHDISALAKRKGDDI